jgi:hypothetical protein
VRVYVMWRRCVVRDLGTLRRWLFRYILIFLRDGLLPDQKRLLVQVRKRPSYNPTAPTCIR